MAQDAVTAFRVGVVVGVPLQIEQHRIRQRIARVPAVQVRRAFVAGIGFTAFQPVMFDIIDDFQGCRGKYALCQEEQQPRGSRQCQDR